MSAYPTTWDGGATSWDGGGTTWDVDVLLSPDGCWALQYCTEIAPTFSASNCLSGTPSIPCSIVPCFIPCGELDVCAPPPAPQPPVETNGSAIPCLAIPCNMIPCRSS